MAYECPVCEGKGEHWFSACRTCGGEGTVETRIFCAACGCHESLCECEEPDLYEDENLKEAENEDEQDTEEDEEEPEDDESDDTEDDEDIEEDEENDED